MTYIWVLPALLYAFHRRDWVISKFKGIAFRWKIRPHGNTSKKVCANLNRLVPHELEVLLECLLSDSDVSTRVYGHKKNANGKWIFLPDSTYSRLVRILEIVEALETPSERSFCINKVAARLRALN